MVLFCFGVIFVLLSCPFISGLQKVLIRMLTCSIGQGCRLQWKPKPANVKFGLRVLLWTRPCATRSSSPMQLPLVLYPLRFFPVHNLYTNVKFCPLYRGKPRRNEKVILILRIQWFHYNSSCFFTLWKPWNGISATHLPLPWTRTALF